MKNDSTRNTYGFVMVAYETPQFITDLFKKIPEDKLYVEDDNDDYGLETNSHVTLIPCMDNDTDIEAIKKIVGNIDDYTTILVNLSIFRNDNFDVLKCDAMSPKLFETNKAAVDKFPTHSEYKEYHPHMTVGYFKKDCADEYEQDVLTPLVVLKPKHFIWSYWDGDENKRITWK